MTKDLIIRAKRLTKAVLLFKINNLEFHLNSLIMHFLEKLYLILTTPPV